MGVTYSRREVYDALKGKWIREIKPNDIFYIGTDGYESASAGATLASGTTDSNSEVYLALISAGADTAGRYIYVTVDSSTILPILLPANNQVTIRGRPWLYKVGSGKTISIVAGAAGTYTAFLIGVREPVFEKVETV